MHVNVAMATQKQRVVITGGPSTGKTSIINELLHRGYCCFEEISRQVTLEAQQNGIEQLFLKDPLLFSQKLLDGRIVQHQKAWEEEAGLVFLDRGVPDVLAYLEFSGDSYPDHFINACKTHRYDLVFMVRPWEEIYQQDNERYESFEQALEIDTYLEMTYARFGYQTIEVPFDSVQNRVNFIINHLAID